MAAHLLTLRKRVSQVFLHHITVDTKIIQRSKTTVPSSKLSGIWGSGIYQPSNNVQKLDHKDWLSPNEVLNIFKNLKDPELIVTTFEKLSKRKDYKPNEAVYSIIIKKLAYARKFEAIESLVGRIKKENLRLSDDFFYVLIKLYSNIANNPELAIKALFGMPDFNCWPTIRTFNFVLNMLVCAKQFEIIHEVYLRASHLGLTFDTCCFNILIKALCKCDKLDAAFALLHEIPKQGCRPNATTYSTLMHGLCEHGKVSEAFILYERMERESCHPDTVTFNILISGLCKEGRIIEATELLDKMKLTGCSPNSGSYQALLYGLLHFEKFVEAKDFMDRMVSEGKSPSFLSYKLLIDGLCNRGLIKDVDLVLKRMVRQGFIPRMGTWKKILESMFSINHVKSIAFNKNPPLAI